MNCDFTPSTGWEIDVSAPACGTLIQSLKRSGGYWSFDGTSAATPHVTGAAGLLMSYLNRTSADYANLAPEDVEQILQKTATDVGLVGVDSTTGHGRLNIGGALRSVFKPCWRVDHFGTTNRGRTFRTSVYSNRDTVNLTERYQNESNVWFGKGRYFVKTYKIEATINHNLVPTDSIIAFWARPSSCNTLQLFNNNKQLQPRERAFINPTSINQNSAQIDGYAYQVWDESNRYLGWWPADTQRTSRLEYTCWIRDKRQCLTSLEDLVVHSGIQNAFVFPNPTTGVQTLRIVTDEPNNLHIHLLDIAGREVQPVFRGRSQRGDNDFVVDMSVIATGFYIYRIQNGSDVFYLKTVKN